MRVPYRLFALCLAAATSQGAMARNWEVKMLNKGPQGVMVFEPSFLKIAVGDTVNFVPTDKSHNAESIPSMIPPGAATFKGALNKPISVTFSKAGAYGIKCQPHLSMGMVGLVVAGSAGNKAAAAAAAAKLPGLAKKRMMADIARAK